MSIVGTPFETRSANGTRVEIPCLLPEQGVIDLPKLEDAKLSPRFQHAVCLAQHGWKGRAVPDAESDGIDVDGVVRDVCR